MLKLTFTLMTTANCAGLVQDSKGVSKLKTKEYWFQDRTKRLFPLRLWYRLYHLSELQSKKSATYSPHLNRVFLSKKVAKITNRNYQNALCIYLLSLVSSYPIINQRGNATTKAVSLSVYNLKVKLLKPKKS